MCDAEEFSPNLNTASQASVSEKVVVSQNVGFKIVGAIGIFGGMRSKSWVRIDVAGQSCVVCHAERRHNFKVKIYN